MTSSQPSNFWTNKRVIVTGGAGFLGSYVIGKLHQRGATHVYVPRIEQYDLCDIADIRRMYADVESGHLKVEEASAVQSSAVQPSSTLVIHLAALVGGIGANRQRPADFFYANLMMGVQLIHEAWQRGVEKFVTIGTICAYPKFTPIPFKEENLWDGYPEETNAPYGLAKKMLLVQSQAYRQQYGFNGIFLLPVNLYGPRDNFDLETGHVIPALIRKFIEAQERGESRVTLWGDGSPTREFFYAEDAAEGIVLAAERYNGDEPVNLGSGMEISIKDLATKVAELTGFEGEIAWDTSKPNGQPRRALDVSRAEQYFGFRAQMPFDEGLRRTIEWYKNVRRDA
ncbi:MAG: GDP-L-fucose synthase family protein [Chloroflexota bacterium]